MKKVFRIGVIVLICVGAAAFVAWPQTADDPLDLLKVAKETTTLVFENQYVRVIDDRIPPGVTEPMHRHKYGINVYVGAYSAEIVTQDGKKSVFERKPGTAGWGEPTVHTVKNVGTTTSHTIRIDLKLPF